MSNRRSSSRKIFLFVEGDSERGDAVRQNLPSFFYRWLDPRLPKGKQVALQAVKSKGVGDYIKEVGVKTEVYLQQHRADVVFGIVDLYGIPRDKLDLVGYPSLQTKIEAAHNYLKNLVPEHCRNHFRQHFAVHELEAWLLAYPDMWPQKIRAKIAPLKPEEVNFDTPPSKWLRKQLGREFKRRSTQPGFSGTSIRKLPSMRARG
jgi:hypothetical protein